MALLIAASVLAVSCHKKEEESFEEDGGEKEEGDHFDKEGHVRGERERGREGSK